MVRWIRKVVRRSEILSGVARAMRLLPRRLRRWRSLMLRSRKIRRYLASHAVRKVHLGAGPNALDGWLNTDYDPRRPGEIFLDVTKRFPFPSGSLDYIYTEHMIEHIAFDQAWGMLRECYRVLRPGGRIRLATPGLDALLELYAPRRTEDQDHYLKWIVDRYYPRAGLYGPCFALNGLFLLWGHQFVYDKTTLQHVLREAGFTDLVVCEIGQSDDAVLQHLESHGSVIEDETVSRLETIVVEGRRPA